MAKRIPYKVAKCSSSEKGGLHSVLFCSIFHVGINVLLGVRPNDLAQIRDITRVDDVSQAQNRNRNTLNALNLCACSVRTQKDGTVIDSAPTPR